MMREIATILFLGLNILGASSPLDTALLPAAGWIPGSTVGVVGGIPPRTNGVTTIDITAAPYNADPTGVANCSAVVNSAIAAASSNTIISFPNGRYRFTGPVVQNKDGITFRGQSYGGVTWVNTASQLLQVGGSDISPVETINISSGSTAGSSNIVLASSTVAVVGDLISVQQVNITNELRQVISVAGYNNLYRHPCRVMAKSGTTITFWPPLPSDRTNSPSMTVLTGASVNPIFKPIHYSGFENIIFTMTNMVDHTSGSSVYMVRLRNAHNCWFKNCKFESAANYNVEYDTTSNCQMVGCTVTGRFTPSPQSNHSGLLAGTSSGTLIENTFFHNYLFYAIEFNSAWSANAVFGCSFTNNWFDVDCHNAHASFDLFEANQLQAFQLDGYFGSASEITLYRNDIESGVPVQFKRFSTYCQAVGNNLGIDGFTYSAYAPTNSGAGACIFIFGYPNIGNLNYTGATGPNWAWNWPGTNFNTGSSSGYTIIGSPQSSTTTLLGNFSWLTSAFTNQASIFNLVIQRAENTNMYSIADNGGSFYPVTAGTSTSLPVSSAVTVSSGDIVYMGGQTAYQALQTSNRLTHVINANWDAFNQAQTFDANYSPTLFSSILYSNSPPCYWGSVRWPAMQPESGTRVVNIPASIWAASGADPFSACGFSPGPPSVVRGLTVTGRVTLQGKVTLGTQ